MSTTEQTPARSSEPPMIVQQRGRRRGGLSVQSIVLIMLLSVSVVSNVLVGVIGYVNATDSLREAAFQRLIEVRDSRAREVTRLFSTIENTIVVHARGQSVYDATIAFTEGFDELEQMPPSAEQDAALAAYYADFFGPQLEQITGSPVDASSFIPPDRAARYLQVHYTVPHADFTSAIAVDDAGDGSDWSTAHAQYHDYFRAMTERLEYEDVLLIDPTGRVVYSAYKGIDLGADIASGPYRFTALGEAFVETISSNVTDEVTFTDLGDYAPALGVPAGWAMTPVARDGVIVGVMAVELPLDRLSAVMTANGDWTQGGLGETGEVYLVGADSLMRSPSRLFTERPDEYVETVMAAGTPRGTAELALARGSTLAVQPVTTSAVEAALGGATGTLIGENYLGHEVLAAYRPLDGFMPNWVVVAETDTSEAFAPVTDFTRNLVISSAVLALIVSVLSLILARVLVRPLRQLSSAAQRIAAGEEGVVVDAGGSDEIANVANAFNDMSRSLQIKADLLEEQSAESERLLRALMPEPVIKRYREGAETIAEDHQEVSVMFADIVGFDDFARGMDSESTLARLNELVKAFDETGNRLGVEHVRTTTKGYLASCGLTVPRIDNARRMVEFAIEIQRVVERFGARWGAELSLRAGVDVGSVTSGLVGRAHMVYDLWGEAVNLVFQIQGEHPESGIFITQRVVERLPDQIALTEAGIIQTAEGTQRIWQVSTAAQHD
jgi:class 3 adenylate cyclase